MLTIPFPRSAFGLSQSEEHRPSGGTPTDLVLRDWCYEEEAGDTLSLTIDRHHRHETMHWDRSVEVVADCL